MKITIDNREPSEIVEKIRKRGADVSLEQLDVGDYVYVAEDPTKSFVIERKTWNDFIHSFTEEKPRLFEQLQNLVLNRHNYRPVMIIIGSKWQALTNVMNPQRMSAGIRGIRSSIAFDYQIPTVEVEDEEEFVETIFSLINQAASPPGERPIEFKKRYKTVREQQEDLLTAIRGIGMKTAKKLLDQFGTARDVINQEQLALEEVAGPSVGGKLYNTVRGIELEAPPKKPKRKYGRRRFGTGN